MILTGSCASRAGRLRAALPSAQLVSAPLHVLRICSQSLTLYWGACLHWAEGKQELARKLLLAKEASGKTFNQIAAECGLTNLYAAQLFFNQVPACNKAGCTVLRLHAVCKV